MAYKFQSELAILSGAISPSNDDAFDIGAAASQYKDFYLDGIAYIDQLGTAADAAKGYIMSGTVDSTVIGGTTKAAGTFTTATVDALTATANLDIGAFEMRASSFESDVATGTAPFTVASTTVVANLNASTLGGATMAVPGAIGGGTPAAGSFTVLTSTSTLVMPTNTAGYLLVADGTDYEEVAVSGDATLASGGALTIGNLAVTEAKIADDAVSLAKMAALTRASIIIGDASGNPSALAKGAAHTFLQSDGTDTAYVLMSGDATLAAGVLSIGATKVTDAMINDDVAAALAGVGLGAGSGVMTLEFSELSQLASGDIELAEDWLAVMENDGVASKRMTMVDYATKIAGSGITATNGVLSTDAGGTPNSLIDGETLSEGFNYATGSANTLAIMPPGGDLGDQITVKNNSGGILTINGFEANTIDGESGTGAIVLDSPYAAVKLVYATSGSWAIV